MHINKRPVLSGLSNTGYLYPERAVSSRINLSVKQEKGIIIDFQAVKGEAILNGLSAKSEAASVVEIL